MKLLFITTEGFDTPGPNNQMAMVMIKDFLKAGINVHLIQSRRKRINADIPDLLQAENKFTYDIVDRKVIDKTNFIKRYIDEATYAMASLKKWRKIKGVDVVFLQSCPTVVYQLVLLKIFHRKPIIYNIYDIFPGHAYDIGVMKSKFLYNTLKLIQKLAYKLSTVITVLSEDMKQKVIDEGVPAYKIKVVPPWYDDKAVKEVPLNENKFIEKYNISKDKFYVQFAGTIGYVFDYKTVLRVAENLMDEDNIRFQIIGDGNIKAKFEEEAKEKGLDNIEFYPLQPLDIVPDVYSACSLCLIPLVKGVIGNGVPSKAPLLMACGRVIVSSVEEDSTYAKMLNENKIGIATSHENSDHLAHEIRRLYHNQEELIDMQNKAKKYGETNFNSTANTRKFIETIYELGRKERG